MQGRKSVFVGFISFVICHSALGYDMPIGIPEFNWGGSGPIHTTSPEPPNAWTTEEDGFYYIEPSHVAATDTNNRLGTPTRPRLTLPSTLNPGSVIILSGDIDTDISISNYNCTETAPCWIKGLSETNRPTISQQLRIQDSHYLFIEHLDFNGGISGAIFLSGIDTHHIAIRHNEVRNRTWQGNTSAIGSRPDLGGKIHNIVIYDNELHDLGDYTLTVDQDFQGFNPTLWDRDSTTSQFDIWFLDNNCYRISGDCVQINAGNWSGSENHLHHIYVGNNTAYQNRQGGYWVKQASDIIISQNLAYEMNGGGSGNAGHGIGGQYPKKNIWFLFNEVRDSVYGFRQSDTSEQTGDIYIIGNLFHNIRPSPNTDYDPANPWSQGTAIALWHGNSNRHIIDNTIHNVYDGINAIYSGEIELSGNIISQIDNDADNHFFYMTHPTRNNLVEMDYNLFIDDGQESYYSWWNNSGHSTSLSDIQAVSGGQCTHCLAIYQSDSTELFSDLNSGFSLKQNSPATGNNIKHSVYELFSQLYGLNIYVDFHGIPRPAASPSIGAFEVQNLLPPPSPPVLLQ